MMHICNNCNPHLMRLAQLLNGEEVAVRRLNYIRREISEIMTDIWNTGEKDLISDMYDLIGGEKIE